MTQKMHSSGQRQFTLVELLAAMAILVILMALLFHIIAGAQQAWSLSDSNARVYAKAHILFDVLARDLGSAVADTTSGEEIPFWIANATQHDSTDATKASLLCMVSAVDSPNADCVSRLCEVLYSFHTSAAAPDYQYMIRRSVLGDRSGGAWNANWDFYGRTPEATVPTVPPSWATGGVVQHVLVDGVERFTLRAFPDTGPSAFPVGRTADYLPQAVIVDVTFVDEKALALPDPVKTQRLDASRRQFRKIIFLKGRS